MLLPRRLRSGVALECGKLGEAAAVACRGWQPSASSACALRSVQIKGAFGGSSAEASEAVEP